jgi:hypothetical protein
MGRSLGNSERSPSKESQQWWAKKRGLIVAKGKLSQALPVVQVRNIEFVEWVLFTQSFPFATSCMPLLTLGSIVNTFSNQSFMLEVRSQQASLVQSRLGACRMNTQSQANSANVGDAAARPLRPLLPAASPRSDAPSSQSKRARVSLACAACRTRKTKVPDLRADWASPAQGTV